MNSWGDRLNTTIGLIDSAIAGFTSVAVAANVALTSVNYAADQARSAMLKFTGAGGFTVTIPSVSKPYLVWNAATAAVTVTTGSGNTVVVEPSAKVSIFCDGTNVSELGFGGLGLKDYIDAAILATTGSLPATTGNNGKALVCVGGAWTPTNLTAAYFSSWTADAAAVRTGTTTSLAMTPGDTYNGLAAVTLTDAATIAVDFSTGINFTVTLAGNRTLGNPTNVKPGQAGRIQIVQDATGSRTLAFASNWLRDGGDPTLSTTAAAKDYVYYDCVSSTEVVYSFVRAPTS